MGAGAGCLALRGGDAYLAQAGPAVAYVRTAAGEFRRIAPAASGFDHALGVAEEFDPQLTRIQLDPGDLVLVASTQLAEILPEAQIERVLSRGSDEVLPELYLLCRDRPNMALVLLSCFEAEPEQPPEFLTRNGAPVEPPPEARADDAAAAEGLLVAAPASGGPEPAEASLAAGVIGDMPLPPRPIEEQVREITDATSPSRATNVRLRGDSAAPRYRRSTGIAALPQFQVPKLVVFAVIALALLGGLAYWQLPGSVQQSREDKFTKLVAAAREANARAQATGDSAAKRQLLGDARAKLVDAAKIHKDNADVVGLTSDVAAATAVLDAVYEIKDFTTVADLQQQATGSLSLTSAVIGGSSAYFLDAKGKRVLRVALAGGQAPESVFREGEPAGFMTASRPMQIAWSEETKSLTIVDDKRQSFAYFPDSGALPVTVRGSDSLGSIASIAGSGGNLYVLDVKSNQVWRYLPGQSGYDSERTGLLDGATLTDATELAVGQDVYVLDAKAGIRRFIGKTEAPFPLAGIDTGLVSPASLSVLPGSNRLVVADRGNKRIIVASAEGAFLRQIVSSSFTDLRAVAVDEGKGVLYVLNGDTLLQAAFPP